MRALVAFGLTLATLVAVAFGIEWALLWLLAYGLLVMMEGS